MADQAILIDPTKPTIRNLAFLKAGQPIIIDISTPAGQKKKFNTSYIGYLPKKYVLVEFPDSSKLGNFSQYIAQGTVITVRGLIEGRDGAAVAFISTVKQTLQIPSRIMVLDIPNAVTLQNLRTSMRIDTQIAAKVKIDEVFWQTTMTNLSVDGGQLDIVNGEKLVLAEDKIIDIVVEARGEKKNIELNATVCNIKQQVDGVSFGVKFNSVSKEQVVELLYQALV
ncbi:PilZ domain-containing protein [Colwellia sp. E2M01]|uniref:PilZ domain-containing protein n=1 Tax=Colwellia sp. E2M01 TaxID=2841561 RepID=UPI001C087115|nr:PilZ domain-containing protein [Colwellia sp. E2M01]MBU2869788.1 flagellar brake protein [Colwellia sp. E2M01]